VSTKQTLRNLLLIGAIAVCLMVGTPMTPEKIEELLSQVNQPRIAHVLKKSDKDKAPDPPF
jgi:hypothetical protein